MEQQKFIETVELLRKKAEENDNKITKKEIEELFSSREIHLDESQMKMVYAYFRTSKVEVIGGDVEKRKNFHENEFRKQDEEYEDRDKEFVRMYQSDIRGVRALTQSELMEAMKKPEEFREQIINTYLKDVVKWVKPYACETVLMSDLIQEGNIGLMEGVAEFNYEAALCAQEEKMPPSDEKPLEECAAVKKLRDYLKESVIQAAQAAIYAQEGENNVGYKIAGRVNAVNDCAKELSEDLGRRVTLEELADKLEMTYEEVKEIVDLSSNKIEYIHYF